MNCLKCGREVPGEQVFCEDCLLEMEKYPIKPGTVVQLPTRREGTAARKTPKRRSVPLEDQVKTLRRRVRILTIALLLTLALAIALAFPAAEHLLEEHFLPGQNYSTLIVTTAPAETEEPVTPAE